YIKDNRTDDFLPVLNELNAQQTLNYTNERAFGLYHKSDSISNMHLENYYIYKIEDAGGPKLTAEKTKLNTIGSFVKYNLSPWTFRAQLADQFGHYGSNDREGLGGYIFVDRDFRDATWSPQASVGFLYLSGDDRNTSKNEAWDPIFSKWPWMSELYVNCYKDESGLGYWTNLQMFRTSLILNPMKKTKLSLWYNYLRANETVAESTNTFADGKERGHLPQIRLDYAVNKNINTYVLAEYFIPGNFYVDAADPALFLRTEIQIKF
ncbi:MAG: alginate export family protein, partial [Candidatus Omnitrophica bacterium]|nr:alginate export family protein [Candidatus Omnitrophota bacterium]